MTFRIFTMGSNRVLCPTLDVMLKKTILALCEVNVKYNNKLEISGSLHVRSDGGRVFTLLIDEEVMNLANKRDRDFSQGQGHPYPGDHGRGTSGAVKPTTQSRRASVSSISGVQMPETSSSCSGLQHAMASSGRLTGQHRMSSSSTSSQAGAEREAQSLSSTVPDVGPPEGPVDDVSSQSQHGVRNSRHSSMDNHAVAMTAAVTSGNVIATSADNAMDTNRAGSTLDAIVSNLHSAAMEMEMAPNHENEQVSEASNHHPNGTSIFNHIPNMATPTSYANSSNSTTTNNNSGALTNSNNNNTTDARSPGNSTSPKSCGTPNPVVMPIEEERQPHVVKVEPTETPSSSNAPPTLPAVSMPQMMVSPIGVDPTLDHKAALKMAPVEHVKGGNKKWQCVFCGILVSSKFYLSSHINAVHTRTRIYPCEICGKMFYSHGAQRIHKLRNHWVEKRHKCPFCGQLFVLPFELRQHVQKKHRGQTETSSQEQTQTST